MHGASAAFDFEHGIGIVIGLLIVAMAVAVLVRRFRLPYTVVLVLVGIVLALARKASWIQVDGLELEGDLYAAVCYTVLLPILLFEAALNLKWEMFSRNARPIFGLAILGTIINISLVGILVHFLLGMPWGISLLLGAIISPTDPLSVVVTFRQLGVARRLSVLVEGESLFNDAVGLVIFSVLLTAVGSGNVSVMEGVYEFLIVCAGGVAVGAVLGFVAAYITRHVDDHLIEVTLSTILAYGSFLVAEQMDIGGIHFSGVIAVVVAGLAMGNYGRTSGMSATTIVALDTFWEYLGFVANSLVFLLIGIELSVLKFDGPIWDTLLTIGILYAIVLVARAAVSYAGGATLGTRERPIPRGWRHLIFWGGLKGALSMVMVLRVPRDLMVGGYEYFDTLLTWTFGVVFLSLVIQGLSIRKVVGWLGLAGKSEITDRYEAFAAKVIAGRAAVEELDELRDSHVLTASVRDRLAQPYMVQVSDAEESLEQLHDDEPGFADIQARDAMRRAHHAEKSALLDAFRRGVITEEALHDMVHDLDDRHHMLEAKQEVDESDAE